MNTYERQQLILQRLKEHGKVIVTELAQSLDASEGTIRNDLTALEEQRLLTRIRGGAIPFNGSNMMLPLFDSRVHRNAESKKKMARWASELVADGDVILLDASTTAYHMATFLADRQDITIVTNHIETARLLNSDPTKRVILLGGHLRADGLAVTGDIAQDILKGLRIHRAFISCVGFSMETGLMEADLEEANLKRQVLQSSSEVVALVDSSKFGRVGLKSFAAVSDITHLVTDDGISPEMMQTLRHSNIALTICGESSVQSLMPQYHTNGHYRIGFANLSEELAFSIDVRRGLERAAKASDKLDIIYVDNNLDGENAIRLADELINRGVDLVIEYQIDELAGNVLMNKFKQHQIPVIAVDIPMVGATYFGVDNFTAGSMAGRALGQWIRAHWDSRVDYVVVMEERRAGPLPGARIQGQLSGLEEMIGTIPDDALIFVDSGNAAQTSYTHVLPVLSQLSPISRVAFVCFNDDAVIGVLQAVRELGFANTAIVGQGADRQIRAEIRDPHSPVIGSTAFFPELYGQRLIEIALRILSGAPLPPAVYMEHHFIDGQNIAEFYPDG
ncbi:substrate-binding domain-containing protein [Anaerolineae bacterium CFX9]|uniref:Substrate-binding domain-containing protein n=1 Tax=Geitlerinema calcuttense NRMC-F 0142 TaxID=2922238 RepID=A0ABT7LW07_9CYAN|nr:MULTISPECIES: substrate-binding domain-containing protein [Cyanophyceae]MDL1900985.1 substrate-binding domain-containing protein [Anaerolineae bacterium CFX9]MDL5055308.1 substrate-binding domain-containing protein [Oscillatoria laete-virens NRMC-F 0139]MDL5056213.1 substrate-binding domain-containing protein [Geitlerinema calcuttense NRMC-F 0142]